MAVHNIAVVGASSTGLSIAHYLLQHTIPRLEGEQFSTLISTADRFLFKVALPRTVASPDLIPTNKVILLIEDAFKSYPADHFKLIIGAATALDEGNKTVSVNGANGSVALPYATLVIATGSRTWAPLWTLQNRYQQSEAEFQRINAALQKPSTVLIAGGRPAGVEKAGEIVHAYLKYKKPPSAVVPASSPASAQPSVSKPKLNSPSSA